MLSHTHTHTHPSARWCLVQILVHSTGQTQSSGHWITVYKGDLVDQSSSVGYMELMGCFKCCQSWGIVHLRFHMYHTYLHNNNFNVQYTKQYTRRNMQSWDSGVPFQWLWGPLLGVVSSVSHFTLVRISVCGMYVPAMFCCCYISLQLHSLIVWMFGDAFILSLWMEIHCPPFPPPLPSFLTTLTTSLSASSSCSHYSLDHFFLCAGDDHHCSGTAKRGVSHIRYLLGNKTHCYQSGCQPIPLWATSRTV